MNELEDMLPVSEESKTKAHLTKVYKYMNIFFWVFHVVICGGMVYLAWYEPCAQIGSLVLLYDHVFGGLVRPRYWPQVHHGALESPAAEV
jgi:hypothetical protein